MTDPAFSGADSAANSAANSDFARKLWHQQSLVILRSTLLAIRIYSLANSLLPKPRWTAIVIVQSIVRRHIACKEYKHLKNKERHRRNILNEIITTERKYHSQLTTIVELFYLPLVGISKRPESLITEDDIKRVFHSIETVYSISTQLLHLLEEREGVDGWVPHKGVADIFLKISPYMKALKGYFENYDAAIAHIHKLKGSSPEFAKFVSIAEKHHSCLHLDLPSLLITPIQRMPRYEMLLAGLTQYTQQDTTEWEEASKAATALQKVNKQINEGMRLDSTQKEMIVLQNLIDMKARLGLPQKHAVLLAPHRKLLRSGAVTMRSLRDSSMQKRNLYLCNDILITVTVVLNTAVQIDKVLPLISAQVLPNQKVPEGNSFFVISPVKSHLFYCDSDATAVSWMTDIQLAIAQLVDASPDEAKRRSRWKLEAVNGEFQVVHEKEKEPDPDSAEFDESFVLLDSPSPPSNPNPTSKPTSNPTSNPTSKPKRQGLIRFDASCTNLVYEATADYFAVHDGCTHIPSTSTYVILPGSIQFIMFVSTGHIKFTNRGDEALILRSHKRGCNKGPHVFGRSFTLVSGGSQAFDFKGAWFVEVIGKCDQLVVSDLALSGGGKGNKLGMA